jgi:serine/threonine-protein kinase
MPDAVGELMARSGGFNVPADYFRSSAMPVPVPAAPAQRPNRWPLYATIAAVTSGVGLMGVVFARSAVSPAQTSEVAAPARASVANSATVGAGSLATANAATSAAMPDPPAASLAPVMREVLVTVSPGDATITRDGTDLGPAPLVLHMANGEVATLMLTRKGYKTKTVKVDSGAPRQSLALEPIPGPTPKPAVAPAAGAIDDVGDPFAKKR